MAHIHAPAHPNTRKWEIGGLLALIAIAVTFIAFAPHGGGQQILTGVSMEAPVMTPAGPSGAPVIGPPTDDEVDAAKAASERALAAELERSRELVGKFGVLELVNIPWTYKVPPATSLRLRTDARVAVRAVTVVSDGPRVGALQIGTSEAMVGGSPSSLMTKTTILDRAAVVNEVTIALSASQMDRLTVHRIVLYYEK